MKGKRFVGAGIGYRDVGTRHLGSERVAAAGGELVFSGHRIVGRQ